LKKPKNATLGAYSAVAFMIVCFVLNMANIIAYKCKSSHSIQQNYKGLESWLTKYAVLTFFGQLLMAIYYVRLNNLIGDIFWDEFTLNRF
jgi:hypothetical protein